MATYKPQVIQSKSSFGGPKGISKVQWNKDHTKVQIKLGEEVFVFSSKNLPISAFPSGEYYVQLNKDETSISTIRPNNGMFVTKVDRFVTKEGEEPSPKTRTPEGKDYSFQYFDVILKIVSPKEYRDMELLLSLNYNFEGTEEVIQGETVDVVGYSHPRSTRTPILIDFCDATGVWKKGPMRWATNILPTLSKRISQADRKFQVAVKNGWITTIYTMPDVTEEGLDKEIEDLDEEVELEPETETEFETESPDVLEMEDDDDLPWNSE